MTYLLGTWENSSFIPEHTGFLLSFKFHILSSIFVCQHLGSYTAYLHPFHIPIKNVPVCVNYFTHLNILTNMCSPLTFQLKENI